MPGKTRTYSPLWAGGRDFACFPENEKRPSSGACVYLLLSSTARHTGRSKGAFATSRESLHIQRRKRQSEPNKVCLTENPTRAPATPATKSNHALAHTLKVSPAAVGRRVSGASSAPTSNWPCRGTRSLHSHFENTLASRARVRGAPLHR